MAKFNIPNTGDFVLLDNSLVLKVTEMTNNKIYGINDFGLWHSFYIKDIVDVSVPVEIKFN